MQVESLALPLFCAQLSYLCCRIVNYLISVRADKEAKDGWINSTHSCITKWSS